MDVMCVVGYLFDNLQLAIDQTLAHHAPVTEVAGQANGRQLRHDPLRDPRIKQGTTAMGFKTDRDICFSGKLHGPAEELDTLCFRPGITATQAGDE